MNLLLKNFKKIIYFFSLFIILAVFLNAFYNFYAIVKRPYIERLMWNYGFNCEKYSYGFINKVIKKQKKDQSITIINFKNMPNIQFLFHKIKFDDNRRNLILLNLEDKDQLKKYKIDLKEYNLIEKSSNCYFYKKND